MEITLIYGDDDVRMAEMASRLRLQAEPGDKIHMRSLNAAMRLREREAATRIVVIGAFNPDADAFFRSLAPVVDWSGPPRAAAARIPEIPASPPETPPPAPAPAEAPKPGHAAKAAKKDKFDAMRASKLKEFLDEHGMFYNPDATEDELRILARSVA